EAQRQLLRACGNLAHACTCTGHYGPAASFLGRALELLPDDGDPYLALSLDSTRVLLDWLRGPWSRLEDRLRALTRAFGDGPLVFAEAELVFGLLTLARGELHVAKAHLAAAHAVGSTGGSVPVVVAAAGGLARIQLGRGDADGAAAQALAALDL